MDNYVETLEKQNEELKQALAREQEFVLSIKKLISIRKEKEYNIITFHAPWKSSDGWAVMQITYTDNPELKELLEHVWGK